MKKYKLLTALLIIGICLMAFAFVRFEKQQEVADVIKFKAGAELAGNVK